MGTEAWMSLTEEHILEGLSRAYVSAICFKAGFNLTLGNAEFDYGVDGTIHDVSILFNGKRTETGHRVDFQMKATTKKCEIRETEVIYKMEADAYNKLVDPNTGTPRIVIVHLLPEDKAQWISHTEENLIIRQCAWWHHLKGEPPVTSKSSSKVIKIPRDRIFNEDAVKHIIRTVKQGGSLR